MKQLYAAGTLSAAPAGRNPSVWATSSGLKPDELQAALSSAGYALPPAHGQPDDRPLPVRLALLKSSTGRVLTHITPNGGTYFAHSLLNVPAVADAQLAIQTWGSPLWQRHEPDAPTDLPELPYLPVADVLDDLALKDWLKSPERRELLTFALTALLGTPSAVRIFLAAPSDDVAKVVYAITRVLPAGLLDDFTFSTYEPDPLACSARLIGYDGGSSDWDLPSACYGDGMVGFNPTTSRRSDLTTEVPFATFAVEALASGETTALDDVRAAWQRLGLTEVRHFDLVFRLTRGSASLTKAEITEALRHPPLAATIASRSELMTQLLDWALEDREFAMHSFTRAVQSLRQRPDALNRLLEATRGHGLSAIRAGDPARTANILEVVLPVVAPSRANSIWGDVLAEFPAPDELVWEIRWFLLPRLARIKQDGIETKLTKWLDVSADRLGGLLGLELPRNLQLLAANACLSRDGEPSTVLVQTLARHPALVLSLLKSEDVATDRAVRLFELLQTEAPTHPWFEEVLTRATDYQPERLNHFFERTLTAGKVDADRLVRTQGPQLLELFAGQSGLDRVGTLFLATPPTDLLRNAGVLEFLGKLREEPKVSEELKGRITAVLTVRGWLEEPQFTPETLKPVAEALTSPSSALPTVTKTELFDTLTQELRRRASDVTLQADLETALVHFGPVLANDPTDLYENLLREVRGKTDLGRHPNLVQTFLAIALGATTHPTLSGELSGLDGHAFAIASDAARRGGNRLLRAVDRRSETWPPAARTQWAFLHAAVRPRGFRGLLRDTGLILTGAGIATAAWWIVRLFA